MNYTEAFLLLSKLDKDAQDRILQKTTFVIKNNENYIKMLLELILKNIIQYIEKHYQFLALSAHRC